MAVMDAVVPSITLDSSVTDEKTQESLPESRLQEITEHIRTSMAEPPSEDLLRAYLEDRPSSSPAFVHGVRRALDKTPVKARNWLGSILTALS